MYGNPSRRSALALRKRRALACLASLLWGCAAHHHAAASIASTAIQSSAEPALTGRVIDSRSRNPVQGAVVYGYYALSVGTLGGGTRPTSQVKSFAVVTGAAGEFTLPRWRTARPLREERRERFPVIVIYKPGYQTDLRGLNSIAQWYPNTSSRTARPLIAEKDGSVDWSEFPHELVSVDNDAERYHQLRAASVGVWLSGDCAWETYAPVLLAQHHELKQLIQRTVAPVDLDDEGYLRSGRPHPMPFVDFLARSTVDRLVAQYKSNPTKWACADPTKVFEGNRL